MTLRRLSVFLCCCIACFGEEAKAASLSEALGHFIGKHLRSLEVPIDMDALVKGMQEETTGIAPSFTEEDYTQALYSLEEQSFSLKKEKNLQDAETFLAQNLGKKEITPLENGKVQFETIKKGKGQTVQSYNSPLVRYQARFLNGKALSDSPNEEYLDLAETLPGLCKGIIGMREGEIRKLYIHPELGYGIKERLYPNSLLIFEVEILEADIPKSLQP